MVLQKYKKTLVHCIFSVGHLDGPKDSKSIRNQLLGYIGVIPQIDLPNRVQLVPELERFEYFVGDLPSNLAEAGMFSPGQAGGGPQ